MTEHKLKILPMYFEAVALGIKTFEVRKDDRGFQVGDWLWLSEYENGEYTGRGIRAQVTYILRDAEYCKEGYCIMGIKHNVGIWGKQIAAKYNYTPNCSPEEKQKLFKEMKMKQKPYKKPKTIKLQAVKRGEWDGYICSECNVCADYFISGDFYFDEKPNFCPNCGADMRGEENA